MAEATVKTVQYVDPRIEPQPDPVYSHIIAPTQNQYYKIAASSYGPSSITFNNLTTLGVDRAYLDTMELELTAEIRFKSNHVPAYVPCRTFRPFPFEWTFNSWPLSRCTEDIRVNINGGAFFSQPLSYISAKERYMNQDSLAKCYENICPVQKPYLQSETGRLYNQVQTKDGLLGTTQNAGMQAVPITYKNGANTDEHAVVYVPYSQNNAEHERGQNQGLDFGGGVYPTRLGYGRMGYAQSPENMIGGFNNDILQLGEKKTLGVSYDAAGNRVGSWEQYENMYVTTCRAGASAAAAGGVCEYLVTVKWREPILCSPFSSRYDSTYGRPLYNVTSMDITYTLMDLKNMIRVANLTVQEAGNTEDADSAAIIDYDVKLTGAQLCYQVMTIPSSIEKPLTTLVPYRRFVPYVSNTTITPSATAYSTHKFKSGVYTLNEVPTAIWLFVAPEKKYYQTIGQDKFVNGDVQTLTAHGNWEWNHLFGFISHVNLTLANTTQILNNAAVEDLYRIAKANGCEDSFLSWGRYNVLDNRRGILTNTTGGSAVQPTTALPFTLPPGAGSVLRLKPGVDIVIPDQPLIPGANARNMVFQADEVTATIPPHPSRIETYTLWLLFEYVGVAAISPGQCEVTMNPLGNGDILDSTPVMSATSDETEGQLEGTGFWDNIRRKASIAAQVGERGIIGKLLKRIPGGVKAAEWAASAMGGPAMKRKRGESSGGATIGRGINDWI